MLTGLRPLETRMRYSQYRFRLRHDNPLINALLIVLGALAKLFRILLSSTTEAIIQANEHKPGTAS